MHVLQHKVPCVKYISKVIAIIGMKRYINVMPNIAYNFKAHRPVATSCIDLGRALKDGQIVLTNLVKYAITMQDMYIQGSSQMLIPEYGSFGSNLADTSTSSSSSTQSIGNKYIYCRFIC